MNYWTKRIELAAKAKESVKLMQEKYSDEIARCISQSIVYGWPNTIPNSFTERKGSAEQTVIQDTTDGALFRISADETLSDKKIALLNFASYENPGGKFIEGSSAQEESTCHASFLYNVLSNMPEYYEWNKAHKNKALYMDRAIYSPDVIFTVDGKVCKADVITCAAPNRSVLEKHGSFTEEENFNTLHDRVLFVRNICTDNNVDVAILGAWGCGVFRQRPSVVSNFFFDAFKDTGIKVVYAVPDKPTYDVFVTNIDSWNKVKDV